MASDFLDENWASIEGWPMEISSYGRAYEAAIAQYSTSY